MLAVALVMHEPPVAAGGTNSLSTWLYFGHWHALKQRFGSYWYKSVAQLPMFCIWAGLPIVLQAPPMVHPCWSYSVPIGPEGQLGCDVIMQPQVHEPPLGPS